jgi:hypothetical protein
MGLLTLFNRQLVVSSFDPTDIANCALWLDGSDLASITESGGAVSQWNDKSGNNNHALQSSAAAKPTTGTRTLNGRNVIDFDGSGDFMTLTNPITGGAYTIFLVVLVDSFAANPRSIIGTPNTGGPVMRFANSVGNGVMAVVRRGQAVLLNGSDINSATTAYSFIITTSNSGNAIYRNGVAGGSNATSASYTQDIQAIGSESSTAASTPHDGYIAESAIWTRVFAAGEITQIFDYSASKWGV